MKDSADFQGLEHSADVLEVPLVHLPRFILFPAEGLNLVDAGQVVLQFAVQFAHLFLGNAKIRADFLGEDHAGNQDQGDRRTGDEGQLGIDGQQHDQHAGEGDQIGDRFRDHMGVEQFKIPGVVHHPAHQIAGLLVMEVPQVHALQLVVGPGAQVAHQIPGGFMGQIIAEEAEQDAQQIQPHQHCRQRADLPQARFVNAPFDDARHSG